MKLFQKIRKNFRISEKKCLLPEVGRQDQGEEDQQPGLVRRQPPQEQHGGGGGDGDAAAPGRNQCAPSLQNLCMRDIRFAPGLLALNQFALSKPMALQVCTKFAQFAQN